VVGLDFNPDFPMLKILTNGKNEQQLLYHNSNKKESLAGDAGVTEIWEETVSSWSFCPWKKRKKE
jgi:hypothetical protein